MRLQEPHYTPEFRAEVIKLVTEQWLSRMEADLRLSVPKGTLANSMAVARDSTNPSAPGVLQRNWQGKMPGCVRNWPMSESGVKS